MKLFNFLKSNKNPPISDTQEPKNIEEPKKVEICSAEIQFSFNRFSNCISDWAFKGCRINNSLIDLTSKDRSLKSLYKFMVPVKLEVDYFSKCINELKERLDADGFGEKNEKEDEKEDDGTQE